MSLYSLLRPKTNSTVNASMADVIGSKADTAATGAVTATDSLTAYIKQIVTAEIANAAINTAVPICVAHKLVSTLPNNTTTNLFTIGSGLIRAKIVGFVDTVIGGAANAKLQFTSTTPAATIELNAAAVAINSDAAGTIYYNAGATSVFTPATSLGGVLLDPVTTEEVEFIFSPGTVKFHCSATQTGAISWYMSYIPLTPSVIVAAA